MQCSSPLFPGSCRVHRSSLGTMAAFLLLAASGFWASCGDFTLWSDGPGPGPGPDPGGQVCDNAFAGLGAYKNSQPSQIDRTLSNPVAIEVIPQGMTFSPAGDAIKAGEGDLMVLDAPDALPGTVAWYNRGQNNKRYNLEVESVLLPGGLALHHEEIALFGQKKVFNLLFYTAVNAQTERYNVFFHDLGTQTTLFRYPDDWPELGLGPAYLFTRPAALAMARAGDRRGLFVADNLTSVVRMSLVASEMGILPGTVDKIADGFSSIRDLVFSSQTGALYLTESTGSKVYRIDDALTRSAANPVTKDQLTPFSSSTRLRNPRGLALAPTDQKAEAAALLVFSEGLTDAIGQFDPVAGGEPKDNLDVKEGEHLDLAYDCRNQRLLFTRNASNIDFRGLFQIVPR